MTTSCNRGTAPGRARIQPRQPFGTSLHSQRYAALFGGLFTSLGMLTPSLAASETWAEAEPKSYAAAQSPAVVDWVEGRMHPAFGRVVGRLIERCLDQPTLARPPQLDLVFVVTPSGAVGPIFWKERTAFADCLEAGIRPATFPAPPEGDAYFGVTLEIPQR